MSDPSHPLRVDGVPALGGPVLTTLATLFTLEFGLGLSSDDPGDSLIRAGVLDPDRLIVGFVRSLGDRPGQEVMARHMGGVHGTVVAPAGTCLICCDCLAEYLLVGAIRLGPTSEALASQLLVEAALVRPAGATLAISLAVLSPLVDRAVELRNERAG